MPDQAERGRARPFSLTGKFIPLALAFRMADESSGPLAAVLALIGGSLFVAGIDIPTFAASEGSFTVEKLLIGTTLALFGLPFFIAASYAKAIQERLGPSFAIAFNRVVLDPRYWAGFVLAIFVALSISTVLIKSGDHAAIGSLSKDVTGIRSELKKDMTDIHQDLDTYVMPRLLTDTQRAKIVGYLSVHEPHDVTFIVARGDNEANRYAGQIAQALRDGGWTVTDFINDGPCIGSARLNAMGFAQVSNACLSPGPVVCVPRTVKDNADIATISCSEVMEPDITPLAPDSLKAIPCDRKPCFVATTKMPVDVSSTDDNFIYEQINDDLAEGLGVYFRESMESSQKPHDPKHLKANELIEEVFRQADVPMDGGMGSGSGILNKTSTLTIKVGRRHRDGSGYGAPKMIIKVVPAE